MLNRLPTRALTGKMPYEAWKGVKPSTGHIRVFGCLTHMKVPGVHTTKLSDRSMKVIHLGNEPGTKAYHLFDPESNKILVSRDVIFEEDKTWTWDQQKSMNSDHITTFTIVTPHTLLDEETVKESVNTQQVGSDFSEEQTATPQSQSGAHESEVESSGSYSGDPVNFRSLTDIYNET